MLKQEIQWREPYVSYSLNRKYSGVIPQGIYHGFVVTPGGGMSINIGGDIESHPISIAVFDYNGYNFSVSSSDTTSFTIPDGTSGIVYVAMQSEYINGGGGSTSIITLSTSDVLGNQLILCSINIPESTTEITDSMIDNSIKQLGDWWKKPPGTLTPSTSNENSGEYHFHEVSGFARETISITAGDGVVGGGTINANRTLSLGTPTTCTPTSTNNVTEDSHEHLITGVAKDTTTISAGAGMTGGGALNTNRTLSLGTPSTCTRSTTNSSSGTTHTHYIEDSDKLDGYHASSFSLKEYGGVGSYILTSTLSATPTSLGFTGSWEDRSPGVPSYAVHLWCRTS